jgi:GxxExxY protein
MDANTREFNGPNADEVYQIMGCAFEVLNELGSGLVEKPYENSMTVEFELRKIPFVQQQRFPVLYKTVNVGEYIPDLIAFEKVIIDTKVIDKITNIERAQMLNYLKITGLKTGLIINFRRPKLEWERIVLENHSS